MFIAWGERCMGSFITVAKCEWKMQIRNIGFWLLLALALTVSILDCFPSASNMARLDNQLTDHGYVVTRVIKDSLVLMLFGFVFLVSNRIRRDKSLGVAELYMASPISKAQYVFGKIAANLLIALLLSAVLIFGNGAVQLVFGTSSFDIMPYIIGFIAVAVPACIFTVCFSTAMPVITDIRLVYVAMVAYFLLNMIIVPDGTKLPFYLLASEPMKLFNPLLGLGIRTGALMVLNWLFLIGSGAASVVLLLCTRRYWREH